MMTDRNGDLYRDPTMKRLKNRPVYDVLFNYGTISWEVVRLSGKSSKVLHTSKAGNLHFFENLAQQYNQQAFDHFREGK